MNVKRGIVYTPSTFMNGKLRFCFGKLLTLFKQVLETILSREALVQYDFGHRFNEIRARIVTSQ